MRGVTLFTYALHHLLTYQQRLDREAINVRNSCPTELLSDPLARFRFECQCQGVWLACILVGVGREESSSDAATDTDWH